MLNTIVRLERWILSRGKLRLKYCEVREVGIARLAERQIESRGYKGVDYFFRKSANKFTVSLDIARSTARNDRCHQVNRTQ